MMKVNTAFVKRVCQGDVLRDVEYFESVQEIDGTLEIRKILFPLVVVLSQDCDLAQDYTFRAESQPTQDKWLISVLLAPLYNAAHVFAGNHLAMIDLKSQPIKKNKTAGHLLMENKNPRYQYLEFPKEIAVVPSVIDFKHYFSSPVLYLNSLKAANFVCKVGELYREDISHRFAAFLSRIGLPSPTPNSEQKEP